MLFLMRVLTVASQLLAGGNKPGMILLLFTSVFAAAIRLNTHERLLPTFQLI